MHNTVIPHKFYLLHSKWLLSITAIDYKVIQKKVNYLQMSLSLACSHVSVSLFGSIPSFRLSKPNWRQKLIFTRVPPFKSLRQSSTGYNCSPGNHPRVWSDWMFPLIISITNQQWHCPSTVSTPATWSLHSKAGLSLLWLRAWGVHRGFAVTAL